MTNEPTPVEETQRPHPIAAVASGALADPPAAPDTRLLDEPPPGVMPRLYRGLRWSDVVAEMNEGYDAREAA